MSNKFKEKSQESRQSQSSLIGSLFANTIRMNIITAVGFAIAAVYHLWKWYVNTDNFYQFMFGSGFLIISIIYTYQAYSVFKKQN